MSAASSIEEAWKPIPGWEGLYEVSDQGRVRSIPRKGYGSRWYRNYGGGPVRALTKENGYLCVNLTQKGMREQVNVHRLVLLAFAGDPPNGYQACHNNGVRSDNRLSNLRWDSVKNNHADKVKHGTQFQGRDSRRFKRYVRGYQCLLQAFVG